MASRARPDLVTALLAGAAMLASPAVEAYVFCCDDDGGRQVCADVLPAQCYGRAYRVLNSQGLVIREIEAPLTRDQREARRQEERQKRIEQDRIRSVRLKERALLETYRSVEDIDAIEARAIEEIDKDLTKATRFKERLLDEQSRLRQEREFYKEGDLPSELARALNDNELEIIAQESVIDSKTRMKEAIRERYASDRKAYLEILDRREALFRR
ncbi:MAG: hypothetical protein KDH15_21210 [Rhodocyclaceae bacterium]|nr:hypothetical protein [Rhodocyclaceae bacterium]